MTALADGRANQKIPDSEVLARTTVLRRAVLTNNRKDYRKLHRATSNHAGIVIYTDAPGDRPALAARIDAAIAAVPALANQLIRVNLPSSPAQVP